MRGKFISGFTQYLLYIVFAAGVLLWAAVPFFLDEMLAFFMDSYIAYAGYHTFILVFLMYTGGMGLWIIFDLIGIFKTLKNDPYVPRNVKALRRMGIAALAAVLAFIVKCAVYFTTMTAVCALILLLCALFALVLADVFAKAVDYKRENDLTI